MHNNLGGVSERITKLATTYSLSIEYDFSLPASNEVNSDTTLPKHQVRGMYGCGSRRFRQMRSYSIKPGGPSY